MLCRVKQLLICLSLICASGALAQVDADHAPAWRAASRLGYGLTPGLLADLNRAGSARAWAVAQIDAAYEASHRPAQLPPWMTTLRQPLPEVFERFAEERRSRKDARETGNGKPSEANAESFSRSSAREAAAWRLMACSAPETENPLLARMTEFWFNHLNVFAGKGAVRPFVGHYELQAIRPHVLGRFEDLLLASAKHPAMLFYLDQAQSVAEGSVGPLGQARGLNENYARELMELHTLGVDGGYSQADVRELARILTGWSVGPRQADGFRFYSRFHDRGEKRLLGQRFAGTDVTEGEAAMRLLARQPATARRIATRLASFFVADEPSPALIEQLTRTFLATQGDLRAVMTALVTSADFWQAAAPLFKTPVDYVCSALAATGGLQDEQGTRRALAFLASAGQPIHGWQTPDGYRTDTATWLSPEALTRRADFGLVLGRQVAEPSYLYDFVSVDTRQRILREPSSLRTGLLLSSPDFMRK